MAEEQKIKLEKVDDKAAYENLIVKYAELEQENERLTVSYETLKLHDEEEIGMLKSENADLKKQHLDETLASKQIVQEMYKQIQDLQKENTELREESDFYNKERGNYKAMYLKEILKKKRTKDLLTKAKEIIKKLKALYLYPVVTKDDVKRQDEILNEAEQFLQEAEK